MSKVTANRKANALNLNLNNAVDAAPVVETLAPVAEQGASALRFYGLKYATLGGQPNGDLSPKLAAFCQSPATWQLFGADFALAVADFYGFGIAKSWQADSKGKNSEVPTVLKIARSLAHTASADETRDETRAALANALLKMVKLTPKGGKYGDAIHAANDTSEATVDNAQNAIMACIGFAWAWGYLSNKQAQPEGKRK